MKTYYILPAFVLMFYSCTNKASECDFELKIKFKSNSIYHSSVEMRVSELPKPKMINLQPKASIDSTLCFKNVPLTDGNYIIKIKHNGLDTTLHWGYYTNGMPPDKRIYIEILDNDVKVKTID
jgi:hypothetical protein